MEFVYGSAGLIVGVGVGVIFSGKIATAFKGLEATISARLVSLEQSIVTAIKAKL